jgi:hypothetical protein
VRVGAHAPVAIGRRGEDVGTRHPVLVE